MPKLKKPTIISKNIFNDPNLKKDVMLITQKRKEEIDSQNYKINYFKQFKWNCLKKIKYEMFMEKKQHKTHIGHIRNIFATIVLGDIIHTAFFEFRKKVVTYMLVHLFISRFKTRGSTLVDRASNKMRHSILA